MLSDAIDNTNEEEEEDTDFDMDIEYQVMRERINALYDIQKKELLSFIEDENNSKITQMENPSTASTASNYYYYDIESDLLKSDIEKYMETYGYETGTINICIYQINVSGKTPFIQYILQKNNSQHKKQPDTIKFPTFNYVKGMDIMSYCQSILDMTFICYSENMKAENKGAYVEENVDTMKWRSESKLSDYTPERQRRSMYKGFTNNNNQFQLFFDCSLYNIDVHKLYRENDLYLTLMDEIVNHQSICNFKIDEEVSLFFMNHPNFVYLVDADEYYIETPIVAYAGCNYNQLEFSSIFGISTSKPESLMGPYYYFTDYQNAIKAGGWRKMETKHSESTFSDYIPREAMAPAEGIWVNKEIQNRLKELPQNTSQKSTQKMVDYDEHGRFIKGGLIRFAIFPGNTKVATNCLENSTDKSQITQNMLELDSSTMEYKNARNTIRFSDRDALWTQKYDSVYVGPMALDNGDTYQETPMWVLKDYEQQIPLTIHSIDKRTLKETWSREDKYYIY